MSHIISISFDLKYRVSIGLWGHCLSVNYSFNAFPMLFEVRSTLHFLHVTRNKTFIGFRGLNFALFSVN